MGRGATDEHAALTSGPALDLRLTPRPVSTVETFVDDGVSWPVQSEAEAARVAELVGEAGGDLVMTVPLGLWKSWCEEGTLAGGEVRTGYDYWYQTANLKGPHVKAKPGARVYVCAGGRIRGWAPLVKVIPGQRADGREVMNIVRRGGAVACTIPRSYRGFQGVRWRDWRRSEEIPFPDWMTAGIPASKRPAG